MSPRVRFLVAVVAGVGILSLLLAVVGPLVPPLTSIADRARHAAVPLVPASAIAVLAILYGHGTSCPLCGRWWARKETQTEFVDREVFEKEGVPFARSTYRTSYHCESCRHSWSVYSTEESRASVRDRTRPRLG